MAPSKPGEAAHTSPSAENVLPDFAPSSRTTSLRSLLWQLRPVPSQQLLKKEYGGKAAAQALVGNDLQVEGMGWGWEEVEGGRAMEMVAETV